MKKSLFISVFVLVSIFHVSGFAEACLCKPDVGTNVYGVIEGNVTWTLDGSPYCITQNIVITTGSTLTIEPGVVVMFWEKTDNLLDNKFSIFNYGTLIARGTEAQRIVFTSAKTSPEVGDWNFIQFTGSSDPAVFDVSDNYVSGSILEYVIVEYGGGHSRSALSYSVPGYLSHAIVRNNQKLQAQYSDNTGVDGDGGAIYTSDELVVRDSVFQNNVASSTDAYGYVMSSSFQARGGAIYSEGSLRVYDSTFTGNTAITTIETYTNQYEGDVVPFNALGGAIYGEGEVMIYDSVFQENQLSSQTVSEQSHAYQRVRGQGGAVYVNGNESLDGSLVIERSVFQGNSCSASAPDGLYCYAEGGGVFFNDNTVRPNFTDCEFTENALTAPIDLSSSSTSIGSGIYSAIAPIVSGCSFIDNISENSVIYSKNKSMTLDQTLIYHNECDVALIIEDGWITNSTLVDNSGHGIIYDEVDTGYYMTGSNIFNNWKYDVYNRDAYDVDMTGNYWGTTDTMDIYMAIYDKYDNFNIGVVDFGDVGDDFLTSMAPNAPTLPIRAGGMRDAAVGFGILASDIPQFGFMISDIDGDLRVSPQDILHLIQRNYEIREMEP